MANIPRERYRDEFMDKLYPAFSRRATQVCILSAALEKIEAGMCIDPRTVAREALEQADAFGWKERAERERRDWCTDPDNCARCKAPEWDQPKHHHAGIPVGPQHDA